MVHTSVFSGLFAFHIASTGAGIAAGRTNCSSSLVSQVQLQISDQFLGTMAAAGGSSDAAAASFDVKQSTLTADLIKSLVKVRHHLHSQPETAFLEKDTSALIREQLVALGVDEKDIR